MEVRHPASRDSAVQTCAGLFCVVKRSCIGYVLAVFQISLPHKKVTEPICTAECLRRGRIVFFFVIPCLFVLGGVCKPVKMARALPCDLFGLDSGDSFHQSPVRAGNAAEIQRGQRRDALNVCDFG